jgi:cell division septation protein DedD
MRQNPTRSRTKAAALFTAALALACSAVVTRAETSAPAAAPAVPTATPAPSAPSAQESNGTTGPAAEPAKPRRSEQPRRKKSLEFGIGEDDPAQRRKRPA